MNFTIQSFLAVYDLLTISLQPHRDTEKVGGMFGTLVIQLPSDYEGGVLRVCHQSKELSFDFSSFKGSVGFHYAAFYADCQHELCEVTKGYRLCLIYNLVYSGVGSCPVPVDNKQLVDKVVAAMRDWGKDAGGPPVLAYMLTHKYSEAGLSFRTLKNTDRAIADVLVNATKEESFHLFLGIVSLTQHWSATTYGYDDYDLDDLYEEELTAHGLVSPSGKTIKELSLNKDAVMPEDVFEDAEPDEEEFEEATGNEGATVDKMYQHAALLMWPKEQHIPVMGLDAVIWELNTSCLQLGMSSLESQHPKRKECIERVEELVTATRYAQSKPADAAATKMLSSLQTLGTPELACEFLEAISSNSAWYIQSRSFANALMATCDTLGWDNLRPALKVLFEAGGSKNARACCEFLSVFATGSMSSQKMEVGQLLAGVICKSLVGEQDIAARSQPTYAWPYTGYDRFSAQGRSKDFVCQVFKGLSVLHCDAQLQAVLAAAFQQPNRYPLTTTLIPAAKELHQWVNGDSSPLQSLVSHCVASLEVSTQEGVAKPQNWSQKVNLSCNCADCTELVTFLRDPVKSVARFRMIQSRRYHLQRQLDMKRHDITHVTERVGSPHTLVVTKTMRSFEVSKREHEAKLNLLARIRSLMKSRGESQPPTKRQKVGSSVAARNGSSSDTIVIDP